jgi:hypothetical protein
MRWAILALVLLALAKDARAAPEEPIGDGRLGHVRVGWDGFVPKAGVAPVTVLLVNPEGRERVVRVAVSPRGSTGAEATVVLPPRGTGRASFVVSAPEGLDVSLSEGRTLLASSRHPVSQLTPSAVLEVDGSPGTRAVRRLLESAPPAFGCRVEDLPDEAACYAPFQVVVLRLVDPGAIAPGALAALHDFVRAGGSVFVSGTGKHAGFFDALAGTPEPGALPTKRHGLGHVSLVASDLGAITSAAEVDRAALVSPCARAGRRWFSPMRLAFHENEVLKSSRLSYGLFVFGYALVGAPVIALVLRRVKRRRAAWSIVAGIVLGFAFAGAVVARSARVVKGRAAAVSRVLIPTRGDAVVLAEAVFASGASLRPDVSVEGEELAVTSVRRTFGYDPGEETVATRRCEGRGSLAFPAFPVPSFGEGNLVILAAAPHVRAVEAWVERTSDGGRQLVVRNNTDRSLGPTVLDDWFSCDEFTSAGLPGVAPGETAIAPITSDEPEVSRMLREAVRPFRMYALTTAVMRSLDPVACRYTLLSLEPPPIRVRATNSDMNEVGFRIQAVRDPDGPRGWIGAELGLTKTGELVVTSVAPNSPAHAADMKRGERVFSLAYNDVTSPEDAAKLLDVVGPGGHVILTLGDAQTSRTVTVDILAEPVPGRFRGPFASPR